MPSISNLGVLESTPENVSGAYLGTYAEFASPFSPTSEERSAIALANRYYLQSISRILLPSEKVAECHRCLRPFVSNVEVWYNGLKQSSSFRGLVVCGSVWTCPVCASKIATRRGEELAQAITRAEALGLRVCLETLTYRHTLADQLRGSLQAFQAARRDFSAGKNGVEMLRRRFGYVGQVNGLEVNQGGQGWHPHSHGLQFMPRDADVEAFADLRRARWRDVALRQGLDMNQHGYDLRDSTRQVAEYVSKFGHGPRWGVDAEMTKGHIKRPRAG